MPITITRCPVPSAQYPVRVARYTIPIGRGRPVAQYPVPITRWTRTGANYPLPVLDVPSAQYPLDVPRPLSIARRPRTDA